ncbi:P-loop containing nucleoside triphosphate hydrolase protein [Rostrohypoxylon terebratum]|nr:P-loop containing nucleoside triphosphate hydrolase protein [Rostrohypoxylon terebratum]
MESSAQPRKCDVIFVLGPPGCGKSTVCKSAISQFDRHKYRFLHISMGDYLRDLSLTEGRDSTVDFDVDTIRSHIRESKLLPANIIIPLLERQINNPTSNKDDTPSTWLIDGFPRNMETALAFDEKFGEPAAVIVLECAADTARSRFLARRREETDNEVKFGERHSEYLQNMEALCKHYEGKVQTCSMEGSPEENLSRFVDVVLGIRTNQQTSREALHGKKVTWETKISMHTRIPR